MLYERGLQRVHHDRVARVLGLLVERDLVGAAKQLRVPVSVWATNAAVDAETSHRRAAERALHRTAPVPPVQSAGADELFRERARTGHHGSERVCEHRGQLRARRLNQRDHLFAGNFWFLMEEREYAKFVERGFHEADGPGLFDFESDFQRFAGRAGGHGGYRDRCEFAGGEVVEYHCDGVL